MVRIFTLLCNQSDDTQKEKCSGNPHNGRDVLYFSGDNFQNNPGQDSEHDTVGDGVGKRHYDKRQETAHYIGRYRRQSAYS